MLIRLQRISVKDALGDLGDRDRMAISTLIDSNSYMLVAQLSKGVMSDVVVMVNKNDRNPKAEPDWKYFCTVPQQNIKAYVLHEHSALSALEEYGLEGPREPEAPKPTGKAAKEAHA